MNIIIVGCGRVGAELANLLSSEGHNVVVIDKNPNAFSKLGNTFNGLTLTGNGFSAEILKAAGIEKTDALCAVTNGDNTNIMASQVAKKIFNISKVIARVYDPKRAQIYKTLGLDIISGTELFAAMIRDKVIESKFSSYLIETGDLGAIEIDVNDKFDNKTVETMNINNKFLIVTVIREKNKEVLIPEPKTILKKGDRIIAVVKTKDLNNIKKTLGIT
ncbi:MAG: TrkA family potassium uptake protein [Candidatus Omnitrophica bacterium]|nr:TrkA family potassium uptake protein [Candidatus Omnitrophota bacterium]